jgi:hypothetical protein
MDVSVALIVWKKKTADYADVTDRNNQTAVATALWAVSNIENSSRSDGPQGRGYNDGEQNKTAAPPGEA